MQENGVLFDDELDEATGPALSSVRVGGVHEAERSYGVEGLSLHELSRLGYLAVLNLGAGAKRRQTMYHVSVLPTVISTAERLRYRDFYVSNGLFASDTSRRSWNVKSMQLCWVDLDCYAQGIVATDEFVEQLLARAHFAGVPHPSHIVSSGRGLYLKWLLDKPVPDTKTKEWKEVQQQLSQLFIDLGADVKAIDAARVLRVVNTVNGKVSSADGDSESGLVRVVWDSGKRHSFDTLHQAVSLFDELTTRALQKAGAKVGHRAGSIFVPNFTLPTGFYGDVSNLTAFTDRRLDMLASSGRLGKNGRFDMSLSLARALDLRDLALMRCRASGSKGIPEGSRDLFLFWLVTFFSQGGVINSRNVHDEVTDLVQAFDGVGLQGPHGFLHPKQNGSLNTLINRIKASEAGHRVRFAGSEWDPRYTPSNDYLINVLGITSEEMPHLRTLIDENEKRARADRKVEGRAQRREARSAWQAEALRFRDELAAAREAGDTAVPERKVASSIASKIGQDAQTVRAFLRRHDNAVAIKEARTAGTAPPRAYHRLEDLTPEQREERRRSAEKRKHDRLVAGMRKNGYVGDGSLEDVQAWFDEKKAAYQNDMARNAAAVIEEARAKREDGVRNMEAQLQRLMRHARKGSGMTEVLDRVAYEPEQHAQAVEGGGGGRGGAGPLGFPHARAVIERISRDSSLLRDNSPNKDSPSTMNTLPKSPAESPPVSSGAGKSSKRALLEKARKAQAKEALPSSANDPSVAASDAPPAFPLAASGPAAAAPIATSVIPPDLLESWDGNPADDSDRAGMPDLDDGYLDSFADGDAPAVGQPPPAAPAPMAPPVSAAGPPAVLAFARGTKPGSAAAAPGRGFGFSRPAPPPAPGASGRPASPGPPAAAPAGFSLRKPAAPPTKPLGFGAPARFSPGPATGNGKSQDFAKLFDAPQYGDDGVPASYPTPDIWPNSDLPAGSRYTPQEWADARQADPELPHGHVVVELQVGNPVSSALIKVPRMPVPLSSEPPVAQTLVVNGKVVKQEPYRGIDDPMADAIADTIVVSRKSPIAEEVRGAVEGGIEIAKGGVSSYFRIIRPRSHYSDPEKFIYLNSKLHMSGSLSEAGARMAPKAPESLAEEAVEQGEHEQHEEELEAAADAPRG